MQVENCCARRQCRRRLLLLCTAKAIAPPQRVVFNLVGVGVCGRVVRVRARVRALVLFEMGAARHVAAAV